METIVIPYYWPEISEESQACILQNIALDKLLEQYALVLSRDTEELSKYRPNYGMLSTSAITSIYDKYYECAVRGDNDFEIRNILQSTVNSLNVGQCSRMCVRAPR